MNILFYRVPGPFSAYTAVVWWNNVDCSGGGFVVTPPVIPQQEKKMREQIEYVLLGKGYETPELCLVTVWGHQLWSAHHWRERLLFFGMCISPPVVPDERCYHPDHAPGTSCENRSVGCRADCKCCVPQ